MALRSVGRESVDTQRRFGPPVRRGSCQTFSPHARSSRSSRGSEVDEPPPCSGILGVGHSTRKESRMGERRYGGIKICGIFVIVGIILICVWSFWIGLIVALIGLIAFGGFARGKWY